VTLRFLGKKIRLGAIGVDFKRIVFQTDLLFLPSGRLRARQRDAENVGRLLKYQPKPLTQKCMIDKQGVPCGVYQGADNRTP
jgi:hypothetical protein